MAQRRRPPAPGQRWSRSVLGGLQPGRPRHDPRTDQTRFRSSAVMVRRSKSQSPDPAVSYFDHATPGSAQHSKHEKHRHRDYDGDQHGPETAQAIREHEKHDARPPGVSSDSSSARPQHDLGPRLICTSYDFNPKYPAQVACPPTGTPDFLAQRDRVRNVPRSELRHNTTVRWSGMARKQRSYFLSASKPRDGNKARPCRF